MQRHPSIRRASNYAQRREYELEMKLTRVLAAAQSRTKVNTSRAPASLKTPFRAPVGPALRCPRSLFHPSVPPPGWILIFLWLAVCGVTPFVPGSQSLGG